MPSIVKLGSTGSDVALCQNRLTEHGFDCVADGMFGKNTEEIAKRFQSSAGLKADGVIGPISWSKLLNSPSKEPFAPLHWDRFAQLLGPVMSARYHLTQAQVPAFPPGVTFLPSRSLGDSKTNCTMFTSYFIGNGFDIPFSIDQWKEWQVAKGSRESDYRGYGPAVASEWGVGEMTPEGAKPVGGVYLIQSFTTWPRGHSWLVIDYDEATDKILTLESNTSRSGLDGIGFGGLGPVRSTNAKDWKNRGKMTWKGRTKSYSKIYMAKLAIDHQTVLDWIG